MLALFFQLQPPAVSNGMSYNTYANRIQSRAIIYSTYNKHKTLGLRSVSVVGWYQYTQSTMKFDVACSQRRQQWNEEGGRGGRPAGAHLRRPARRAQHEQLWMIAAVFSDDFLTFTSCILTQSSALSAPYIFSKHHLPDITRPISIPHDVKDGNRQRGGLRGRKSWCDPISWPKMWIFGVLGTRHTNQLSLWCV